jgi:hypothetical protein
MAQIPLGNFAQVAVQPDATPNRVLVRNDDQAGQIAQQTAGTVQRAAVGILGDITRQDEALAKVKASNSLLDRDQQINGIVSNLAEQSRMGNLTYDKLPDAYNAAVAKLDPLDTPGLDQATQGEVGLSLKRLQNSGLDKINATAFAARNGAAKSEIQSRMDMLGKDAGLPNADVSQINARMDVDEIDTAGHMAYGTDWGKVKQDFKDNNWSSHAMQQVAGAGNNMASLQKVQHDLTADDGFYVDKLDANKRTQMISTVTGRIFQVQEHNERQGEIRENRAERALLQMDQQAATGVPPDPASQQRWQAATAGTSVAGEFHTRVAQMNEVQGVLRQPIDVQQQFLEKKRQDMITNGASVTEQANVNRLQSAVDNNIKLMKTDPLTFNALRTGGDVAPLDLSGLGSPAGQAALKDQIASRFDVVKAVQAKYGPEVSRVPFKAPELEGLKAGYNAADDNTKLQILGAVGGAAPTGPDAVAAIKAIAPEQPVTLLAGMAQFHQLKATDGTDVAKTLIIGSKILKDKSVAVPDDKLLQASFEKLVGNAMPGGTPQREQAYQGYKALYVGLAEAQGKPYDPIAKTLDNEISAKAVNMATGGVASMGGGMFGGPAYKVIKPYNMDDKAFGKAVDDQLTGLATASKLPIDQLRDMPMSAVPGNDGSYYLLNAGRVQLNPITNQPLTVKVK